MKARPILFSAPMVRALLEGCKTQTRRVVKNIEAPEDFLPSWVVDQCPYGKPGGLLYVRETWRAPTKYDHLAPRDILPKTCTIAYKAGGHSANHGDAQWTVASEDYWDYPWMGKTRTAIHMPRWASRLTLRLTEVRVERLQDISEADAEAEGAGLARDDGRLHPTYRMAYAELWDRINGAGDWERNPSVWCLSFSVIRKNVDEAVKEMAGA